MIDTALVRFTQDSIGNAFKNGATIDETVAALKGPAGGALAAKFPPIRLVEQDDWLPSRPLAEKYRIGWRPLRSGLPSSRPRLSKVGEINYYKTT
jgi:hypothetical protein